MGSCFDLVERLKGADADAFVALDYLEQPTSREIRRYPVDWRPVAKYVPVLIDEGLTRILMC